MRGLGEGTNGASPQREGSQTLVNELAALVAREHKALLGEREARKRAEATAAEMAALVAREHRRAEDAERQVRALASQWLEATPVRYRTRRLNKLRSFLRG